MKDLMIIQSNAALGYGEYASFIKIPNGDNKFLCIFENEDVCYEGDKAYRVGEIEEFNYASEYDVIPEHKHHLVLDESPLKGTFLFEEFLKTFEK